MAAGRLPAARASKCQLISTKDVIPFPSGLFVQRLGGDVSHLSGKRQANRTSQPCVIGGGAEQGGPCATAPCRWSYEQVVQDENPRHSPGREARIELGESDRAGPFQCQKDHRFIAFEPIEKESPCP